MVLTLRYLFFAVLRGLVQSGPVTKTIEIPRPDNPENPWTRSVIVYRVQVQRIYKGENKVKNTTPLKDYPGKVPMPMEVAIYTDNNSCAAQLEQGRDYVLGGYIDGEDLEIFSCNWIQTWNSLSAGQRIGIRRYYGRNCACRTSLCSWMDPLGGMMDYYCGVNNLYCAMRNDQATCSWKDIGRGYRECIKDATILGFYK